jgi:hypothetical protein
MQTDRTKTHHLMTSPEGIGSVDFDAARIYAIPMRARFRGITVREGMVIGLKAPPGGGATAG